MTPVAVKARRQRAILELLAERPVGSQAELVRALARRGHRVTQSTLSRDLKELRVVRVPTPAGYRYRPAGAGERAAAKAPVPSGIATLAAAEVSAIDANESLVVVRTQIARASGVASYLDGLGLPELLATVAGDDTVLAIPVATSKSGALRARLEALFGLGDA